jgi:hypothetical protein
MRSSLIRFAFAGLAALALATSASAATILQFKQTSSLPPDQVTATNTGTPGTTVLTTNSALVPGGIPVDLTIGPATISANEFFVAPGLTSSPPGSATLVGTTVSQDGYSGTIQFIGTGVNAGVNILTATFSGGTLSGALNGASAGLNASAPTNNVVFTSAFAPVIALMGGNNVPGGFNISFSNIPALTISNNSIASFTAQNSGTFSTAVIPEPTSIVMAGMSVVAGLGFHGLRRLSSSRS